MLKSLLLAACLLGSVAFATNVALADDAKPTAPQAKAVPPIDGCTKDTGSRLRRNTDGCAGVGKSYSSDDIFRTGSSNPGGALRHLDPSIH
jgi:hypothetical protein